jgi:hypothetical protein
MLSLDVTTLSNHNCLLLLFAWLSLIAFLELLGAEYFDFLALVTVVVVPLSCGLGSDTPIDAVDDWAEVAVAVGGVVVAAM